MVDRLMGVSSNEVVRFPSEHGCGSRVLEREHSVRVQFLYAFGDRIQDQLVPAAEAFGCVESVVALGHVAEVDDDGSNGGIVETVRSQHLQISPRAVGV